MSRVGLRLDDVTLDTRVPTGIAALQRDMTTWRRHLHAHPETAFEEVETASFVANLLHSFGGIEVHEGVAETGVVGVLRGRAPGPSIGLRADIDALDIEERNTTPWASRHPGKMHACGHDGHTSMLLGAARALAARPDFVGQAVFIFQPAEENEGGARVMIEDGLFDRFPVQEVYALHNEPGLALGKASLRAGPIMASFDTFEIWVTGQGGHAASPHLGDDVIVAAAAVVGALQTIVARKAHPLDTLVLSCTQFHSGSAWNVLPGEAVIRGTVRALRAEMQDLAETQITQIASRVAGASGCEARVDYQRRYPVAVNHAREAAFAASVLRAVLGDENVDTDVQPDLGSEDFAFMLQERPGAYFLLGSGEARAGLHTPDYDFNDDLLLIGATVWERLARDRLAAGNGDGPNR